MSNGIEGSKAQDASIGAERLTERAHKDGLMFVLLGCAFFLLAGSVLEKAVPVSTVDFRVVYYSARCLLAHSDPYSENQLQRTYQNEGGETSRDTPDVRLVERQYIYLPSAFPFTIPFALLPFGWAQILWLGFTAASLIAASILIWDVASISAPVLSGFLIGLLIADSEVFLILGNPGGVAIGLCVIGAWCFIKERWVAFGILCMALSLMLKPHNAGLVWLLFLLAGGQFRKRAMQTLMTIVILCLPVLVWVTSIAPHWPQELAANLLENSAPGSLSDPGPHSSAGHGIGMTINLQTVISLFRDDPRFYNPVAYAIVGGLILIWIIRTIQSSLSPSGLWFALAPISALSLLPVYHRTYDARLLLLSIPACAILWKKGGVIGWCAALLGTAGIALTGGMPWAILLALIKHGHIPTALSSPMFLVAIQVLPVPLTLLASGVFFLWTFARHEGIE